MIYLIDNHQRLIPSSIATKTTVEHCLEYFKNHKHLQIDSETAGMNPRTKPIYSLQIGDSENQFVIDCRCTNILLFKELLESKRCIAHNAKFDYKFLKHAGINIEWWWDTMLADVVLMGNSKTQTYGLDAITFKYCQIELDKTTRGNFHLLKPHEPFNDYQIKYAAGDVTYLEKIAKEQYARLEAANLLGVVKLENEYLKVLGDIEYNGFTVDKDAWLKRARENEGRLFQQELVLDDIVLNHGGNKYAHSGQRVVKKTNKGTNKTYIQPFNYDLFNTDATPSRNTLINWASQTQVLKILKELYSLEPKDKDGIPSTNENVLKYIKDVDIIPALLKYREIAKEISTYGDSFIEEHYEDDGKIHSDYWQVNDTGRVSSNSPNMQNIPPEHRHLFTASNDGKVLIIGDYSQEEPRILADRAKDKTLTDFYLNGDGDSHSMVATKLFSRLAGEEIIVTNKNTTHPKFPGMDLRFIGKVLNLKVSYGGSAFTVKDDLNSTKEEAQKFIDALDAAFPGKKKYFDAKIKETWNLGYILIDNTIYRKAYLDDWAEYDRLKSIRYEERTKEENKFVYTFKGELERKAKNYPIQGEGANITKLAGNYIREKLKAFKDAWIVNVIHDEYVVECYKEDAEAVAKIVKDEMERAGTVFCKTIPMIVEPKISKIWEK